QRDKRYRFYAVSAGISDRAPWSPAKGAYLSRKRKATILDATHLATDLDDQNPGSRDAGGRHDRQDRAAVALPGAVTLAGHHPLVAGLQRKPLQRPQRPVRVLLDAVAVPTVDPADCGDCPPSACRRSR